MAGFDTLNLQSSAAQLAAKGGTAATLGKAASKPKIFTAAQATTAVQNYAKNIDTTSLNSIIANYQWIFDTISTAASTGDTSISITTTNFDYTYIAPLLVSYGYTVSELPSSATNPSDTSLKYDVTITWPSSTPTPISSISPTSFIAIQNSEYSVTFTPQGGQAPYTFTYTGQLPDGWTSSTSKGVNSFTVQGTSSSLGGGSLVLKVVDSISQSYIATINWNVTQPAQIQPDWNNIDSTSLGFINNKPTKYYLGSTELNWPGISSLTPVALTGIDSIDGNAATVTDGVYTTGTYANPSWLSELAGSKITGSVGLANALTTTRYFNGSSFNGSQNTVISKLLAPDAVINSSGDITSSSVVQLTSTNELKFNLGSGGIINGGYGVSNNGMELSTGVDHPDGPGDLRLVCDYNDQYNTIIVNRGAIGLRSATSDGEGGGTSPFTGITLTPSNITVNGTITIGGLVTFIGGTNGLTKSSVGLANVTNESKATMFTDSTFTGTTTIATANITTDNITTANITQGTLTTVGASGTSLVNKSYVDTKAFFALAIGF